MQTTPNGSVLKYSMGPSLPHGGRAENEVGRVSSNDGHTIQASAAKYRSDAFLGAEGVVQQGM